MTVHTKRTTLLAVASLFTLGLVGCTAPALEKPVPSPQTSSAVEDPLHIEQPKNLAAVSDPCQFLTSTQVQQLRAGSAEPGQSEWGQGACKWRNQLFEVKISPDTVQGQGLRWMAKTAGDNGNPNANVSGYPAVHYGVSGGSCGTFVGTSDKELLLVNFQTGSDGRWNPEYADPCSMADKIAGLVLENVPSA
ncbi:DUF3558 domain-containing protein [Saccharopolyspora spinosa]|uniref:Uncharacterized protein DUF3558 n=1 Tax=Saccharopolyspora spinosa TaxID=60894 RepID=A0A2N3Y8J6_SACSN|nr:DUF3558 domain-containing protein [Saccharopolyspora spinosa]PKW19242.1 uncharacterized protein DUF3558 [Saccharopolyspora spinosa]